MKPLSNYKISQTTGFAMEKPAISFKYRQQEWVNVAENLPNILKTKSLNNHILQLPTFDIRNLASYKDVHLARVLLTTLAQGLVWEDLQINGFAEYIPRNLAIPLYEISSYLGMQPIQTYADTCLFNYKLVNETGPLDMNNCDLIYKMDDSEDFKWFFLVSLQTEFAFAKYGLKPLYDIKIALETAFSSLPNEERYLNLGVEDHELLNALIKKNLLQLIETVQIMTSTISEMYNYVDPTVFYERVRPFMMGWGSNSRPDKKIGIQLEGVTDEPFQLFGPSAVESSIVPAFDELLGVKHTNEKGKFLSKIRDYMPLEHREFLTDLSLGINLQQYVQELDGTNQEETLTSIYNDMIAALTEFRRTHLKLATRYILIPGNKNKVFKSVGTAGSDIGPFLKGLIGDTQNTKVEGVIWYDLERQTT